MRKKTEDKNKHSQNNPLVSKKKIPFLIISGLEKKYFKNKLSDKEKSIINKWEAEKQWNSIIQKESPEEEIKLASEKIWDGLSKKIPRHTNKMVTFSAYIKCADRIAVITLLLIGLYVKFTTDEKADENLITDSYKEFLSSTFSENEIKRVTLPDNSVIILNRGSNIKYKPNTFNRENREVWLEGEAFFDIEPSPGKPFLIHSRELTTLVKGTSFNIKAYPGLNDNSVSVRDGIVEILHHQKCLATLKRNEQLKYDLNKDKFEIKQTDWYYSSAWLEGKLILDHAGLEELTLKIKQFYQTDLVISTDRLGDIKLHGSFKKDISLNEVLKNLSRLYNINFTIEDKQVILY